MTATAPRRLYRSTRDTKIAGVCGGVAEVMGWDPTTVRLLVALSILLPGPQVLAYVIAWVLLPTDQQVWAEQHAATTPVPPMPHPPADPA